MKFTGTSPLIQGSAKQEPGKVYYSQLADTRERGRLWTAHDPPLCAQLPKGDAEDGKVGETASRRLVPESRRGTW